MGLGGAVAGAKIAVGTFRWRVLPDDRKGLSFPGIAEMPIVIVVSQRTGPSTGLPTYTGQAELQFVLHAGQGEFPGLSWHLLIPVRHTAGQRRPSALPGSTIPGICAHR